MTGNKEKGLFKGGEYSRLNACVGKNGVEFNSIYEIGRGYFLAGKILSDKAIDTEFDLDTLIYPIVFNYRQGLELYIKFILEKIGNNTVVSEIKIDHKIYKRWELIKKLLISEAFLKENVEDIDFLNTIIEEVDKQDIDSFNFRYLKDKKGNLLNQNIVLINIDNFSKKLNRTQELLEIIIFTLENETGR